MVVARKKDTKQIHRIIQDIDPDAFISEASVMGVYDNDFKVMKK